MVGPYIWAIGGYGLLNLVWFYTKGVYLTSDILSTREEERPCFWYPFPFDMIAAIIENKEPIPPLYENQHNI